MTLDKLAAPDKLGGSAVDDKKTGPARVTTRLAMSGPAGLGVLLLAGAVAFGHTSGLFAPTPDDGAPGTAAIAQADEPDEPAAETPKPDPIVAPPGYDEDEPMDSVAEEEKALAERTPKPQPIEVAPEPEPEPEPVTYVEPAPQPAPPAPTAVLALNASLTEYPGKVVLTWSAFNGDGFAYYKLVRTTDGDATWPPAGADEMVGAFGSPGETWAKDRPPCGTTVYYRVFAVRHGEYGYSVLAPSNQVSASVACPPPPPPTAAIGLEAGVVEGQVHLSWGACAGEHFNAYKIVRSQTNPAPMYPEGEGTQLIAAIGDAWQTTFVDADVASGQTWFYRVLARADNGGGTYIACQSAAVSVTIP